MAEGGLSNSTPISHHFLFGSLQVLAFAGTGEFSELSLNNLSAPLLPSWKHFLQISLHPILQMLF